MSYYVKLFLTKRYYKKVDTYRSKYPPCQTIGSREGDGNCHLHIGKTIDLTRCSFGCGRRQRLAAARDDIYTLYVHSIISVLQVQLLGVKCT